MRKLLVVSVVVLAMVASLTAAPIHRIVMTQSTQASAQYDSATGALNWQAGGFAWIYADSSSNPFVTFDGSAVNVSFTLDQDVSAGGEAAAWFDVDGGTWSVDFYDSNYGSNPVLTIPGTVYNSAPFNGQYYEYEADDAGTQIGKMWVVVDESSMVMDPTWYADTFGTGTLDWGDDNIAGLLANVDLDGNQNMSDYDTDSYTSTNGLTVTIYADQSEVPEPMTIALLGLGGVLLRRRK